MNACMAELIRMFIGAVLGLMVYNGIVVPLYHHFF